MRRSIVALATTAAAFVVLDFVWLTTMSVRLYRPALGELLAAQPDLGAAVAFYVVYLAGVAHFAVRPGLERGRAGVAWRQGAAFGLVAYATYDLTNQATLKLWPTALTLCDLAWGTFATSAAAWVGTLFALRITRAESR